MKNSNNNLNSLSKPNDSTLPDLLEKNPEDLKKNPKDFELNNNLNAVEPMPKAQQDDHQTSKDPTIFGDWQINCRTIDF
jgi:hypothetical protein